MTGPAGGFGAPGQGHIEAWPASRAAWERARRCVGGGVSTGLRATMPPHPISFTAGSGGRLTDVDGHTYVDHVLGWGPVILGHAHPRVTAAVTGQAPLGATYGSGHRFEYEAAEAVLTAMPHVERLLWSNSGTEANQSAARLARAFTGRGRILKFTGHYHGWHDAMLVNYRGEDADRADRTVPGSRGQSTAAMSETELAAFGDLDRVRDLLTAARADIAAVFVEPILVNSGVLPPPDGFLAGLRALCDETGTVLVFDEVITGFRAALGGATELFGVRPDLSTLAKSLANGYAVAAVAGRADLIDQVEAGVVHAGTYNGNPIGLAAAHATVATLIEDRPHDRLARAADALAGAFASALESAGVTGTAHAAGGVVQVCLGIDSLTGFADYQRADWAAYPDLLVGLLRRGVFALPGGRFYLCAAHTDADLEATARAFMGALTELGGPG